MYLIQSSSKYVTTGLKTYTCITCTWYMEIHTVKYVCSVCKVSLSLSLDKLVDGQDVFFIQPTRSGKFKSCPIVNKFRGINLNMELKRQKSNLYIVCQVKQHPSLVTPKKYILKANKN